MKKIRMDRCEGKKSLKEKKRKSSRQAIGGIVRFVVSRPTVPICRFFFMTFKYGVCIKWIHGELAAGTPFMRQQR